MKGANKISQAPSEDEWRARDDHQTLQRAAEVMGDPHRHRAAKAVHKKTMRGMQKLMGKR